MRKRRLPLLIALMILAGSAVTAQAALSTRRTADDTAHRHRLIATWQRDQAEGVPADALEPLRHDLAAIMPAQWWSAPWWGSGEQPALDRLDARTDAAYASALRTARASAVATTTDARGFLAGAGPLAPAPLVAAADRWAQQISAARTPAAFQRIAAAQAATLGQARDQVATLRAQTAARAQAAAEIEAAGGPQTLLSSIAGVDTTARTDDLDASPVDELAAALRSEVTAGQPTTDTAAQLVGAIATFKQTVAANDRVNAAMQPLRWEVDQAVAEMTPSAAAFRARIDALQASFHAARTSVEMAAVDQQQSGLRIALDAEIQAAACGHDVAAGKVITISLTLQEMVAYQDGCAVAGAPVTTGRPQLPTPPGDYHVFYKTTPFTMVSPWPKGSAFWYPTTPVTWVLEFLSGGYFLHDASWEAPAAYGAGSENNLGAASHGCIHIPTATMQWLYAWTPLGTEVVVTP